MCDAMLRICTYDFNSRYIDMYIICLCTSLVEFGDAGADLNEPTKVAESSPCVRRGALERCGQQRLLENECKRSSWRGTL